jgi:hypothetical protein
VESVFPRALEKLSNLKLYGGVVFEFIKIDFRRENRDTELKEIVG